MPSGYSSHLKADGRDDGDDGCVVPWYKTDVGVACSNLTSKTVQQVCIERKPLSKIATTHELDLFIAQVVVIHENLYNFYSMLSKNANMIDIIKKNFVAISLTMLTVFALFGGMVALYDRSVIMEY